MLWKPISENRVENTFELINRKVMIARKISVVTFMIPLKCSAKDIFMSLSLALITLPMLTHELSVLIY